MFSSSLISLCPTTKVYDVFNENVLLTEYDEQPIAMATVCVVWVPLRMPQSITQ